ncbi:carboxyvinyl-carboxyphosphonate phosphorylmutase [Aliidongia dinghuensis]|uniref:Carboxyvinyl-carboxyphosphonate phosphorylmutase n=1 Tax=Aliidongia dinghuensis TaxID=1867774 RepID=A0A8J2Z242_9PROT|nr:isocitrate lyase/phosphoenolpyruvate mutase family protein [Aliidongia dinghuensis]GGF49591.1 carboxyvinyl-carboxyphosphonate phosphorylmutase [Aliidongia dinghuensis]
MPQAMSFKQKLQQRRAIIVPGAANPLAARVIADLGFEAIYVTGAGVTNMSLGLPDLSFIDLSQIVQHTMAIRNVTDLPLVVDADTGFGNAVNVAHTVRMLERAGASAIQIEDQVMPKRCGHFTGKEVVPPKEMAAKVRAAVDARRSDELLIIARTDARAVEGFQAALDRAALYVESGADVIFIEAPESAEEMRRIPASLPVPQLVNLVVGGRTPILGQADLAEMGFAIALYANVALQGAILGMQTALGVLARDGRMDEDGALVASFAERQRLVEKGRYDELERRYAVT